MRELLKNKIARNAIWIIVGKIFQSLLQLVIGMLTARYLGPSNYGTISYAASIVAFAGPIMNLGFNNVLVREVTNNPNDEGKIFGSAMLMSFFSSLACIVGITFYTFFADVGETVTHYVIILYSITLIFQAFELIDYWFQAKLLSKYMSIVSLIAYTVVSAYKIFLLATGASIYFFAISNSIDYLLIAFSLIFIYRKLGGNKFIFSKETAKKLFSSSKHYIIPGLMITIFAQTDRIMLKQMLDETAVGFYSAATTCAAMTSFVFSAIIDSMRPPIFMHKKDGDILGYEKGIERTYCIVIYLALAQSLAMTIFSKYIILFLYGESYSASVGALRLVVWYTTFAYMGSVRNIWVLGEGKQKYLWILNLGGALMNIILNAALIPIWGINGAAVASVITQFFTNVIMNRIVWPLKDNNRLILRGLNPQLIISLISSK